MSQQANSNNLTNQENLLPFNLSGHGHGIHSQIRQIQFRPRLRWQEDPAYSFERIAPEPAQEIFSPVHYGHNHQSPYFPMASTPQQLYANHRIVPEAHQTMPIYRNSDTSTDLHGTDDNAPIQQSDYDQHYIDHENYTSPALKTSSPCQPIYNGPTNSAENLPDQSTGWHPPNYTHAGFGHHPLPIYHNPPFYQHGYQAQTYLNYENSSSPLVPFSSQFEPRNDQHMNHSTVTQYHAAFDQSRKDLTPFQRSTRNLDQSFFSAEPPNAEEETSIIAQFESSSSPPELSSSAETKWEYSIPARSCPCRKPNHAFMVICEDPQHDVHSPGAVYVHTLCAQEKESTWTCNACRHLNSSQLDASPHSNAPTIEASPTPAPKSRSKKASRRLGRPPKAANPEKKQKGAWTATEESACIQSMRKIKTPDYRGTIDELWVYVSADMQKRGMKRTAGAVKNQWNRRLRYKSGFDERVKQNPLRLVTGALNYERQAQRRSRISTQRITPARTNAQLAAHDSDSTISASGSDRIFPRNSVGQDTVTSPSIPPPLGHFPHDSSPRSADQGNITDASEEAED